MSLNPRHKFTLGDADWEEHFDEPRQSPTSDLNSQKPSLSASSPIHSANKWRGYTDRDFTPAGRPRLREKTHFENPLAYQLSLEHFQLSDDFCELVKGRPNWNLIFTRDAEKSVDPEVVARIPLDGSRTSQKPVIPTTTSAELPESLVKDGEVLELDTLPSSSPLAFSDSFADESLNVSLSNSQPANSQPSQLPGVITLDASTSASGSTPQQNTEQYTEQKPSGLSKLLSQSRGSASGPTSPSNHHNTTYSQDTEPTSSKQNIHLENTTSQQDTLPSELEHASNATSSQSPSSKSSPSTIYETNCELKEIISMSTTLLTIYSITTNRLQQLRAHERLLQQHAGSLFRSVLLDEQQSSALNTVIQRVRQQRKQFLSQIEKPLWEIPHHFHTTALEHNLGRRQSNILQVTELMPGYLRIYSLARQTTISQKTLIYTLNRVRRSRNETSPKIRSLYVRLMKCRESAKVLTDIVDNTIQKAKKLVSTADDTLVSISRNLTPTTPGVVNGKLLPPPVLLDLRCAIDPVFQRSAQGQAHLASQAKQKMEATQAQLAAQQALQQTTDSESVSSLPKAMVAYSLLKSQQSQSQSQLHSTTISKQTTNSTSTSNAGPVFDASITTPNPSYGQNYLSLGMKSRGGVDSGLGKSHFRAQYFRHLSLAPSSTPFLQDEATWESGLTSASLGASLGSSTGQSSNSMSMSSSSTQDGTQTPFLMVSSKSSKEKTPAELMASAKKAIQDSTAAGRDAISAPPSPLLTSNRLENQPNVQQMMTDAGLERDYAALDAPSSAPSSPRFRSGIHMAMAGPTTTANAADELPTFQYPTPLALPSAQQEQSTLREQNDVTELLKQSAASGSGLEHDLQLLRSVLEKLNDELSSATERKRLEDKRQLEARMTRLAPTRVDHLSGEMAATDGSTSDMTRGSVRSGIDPASAEGSSHIMFRPGSPVTIKTISSLTADSSDPFSGKPVRAASTSDGDKDSSRISDPASGTASAAVNLADEVTVGSIEAIASQRNLLRSHPSRRLGALSPTLPLSPTANAPHGGTPFLGGRISSRLRGDSPQQTDISVAKPSRFANMQARTESFHDGIMTLSSSPTAKLDDSAHLSTVSGDKLPKSPNADSDSDSDDDENRSKTRLSQEPVDVDDLSKDDLLEDGSVDSSDIAPTHSSANISILHSIHLNLDVGDEDVDLETRLLGANTSAPQMDLDRNANAASDESSNDLENVASAFGLHLSSLRAQTERVVSAQREQIQLSQQRAIEQLQTEQQHRVISRSRSSSFASESEPDLSDSVLISSTPLDLSMAMADSQVVTGTDDESPKSTPNTSLPSSPSSRNNVFNRFQRPTHAESTGNDTQDISEQTPSSGVTSSASLGSMNNRMVLNRFNSGKKPNPNLTQPGLRTNRFANSNTNANGTTDTSDSTSDPMSAGLMSFSRPKPNNSSQ